MPTQNGAKYIEKKDSLLSNSHIKSMKYNEYDTIYANTSFDVLYLYNILPIACL